MAKSRGGARGDLILEASLNHGTGSMKSAPARTAAFHLLLRLESSRDHADDLLRGARVERLSAQDRDLATALVMGVLRWQILLDRRIRAYLSRPAAKLDPAVRIALRLGAFQLLGMDRIPDHAAIGESVALCRSAGHAHASRMVNAVLRRIAAGARGLPDADSARDEAELAAAHPEWMVARWVKHYGLEQAKLLCAHGQQQPETHLRLVDANAGVELQADAAVKVDGQLLRCAVRLSAGDSRVAELLRSGRARVQDEGSQLVAELAGHGKRILDCCAAPGGKTMILAERNPEAEIDACDASLPRLEAMRQRLAAISALPWTRRIAAHHADAVEWIAQQRARHWDLVLVDAPCSGTGTLGRNPEIRHRLSEKDLLPYAERQSALLAAAMRASSRRIVYSTCSLEPEENAQVVATAMAAHPEWRLRSLADEVARLQRTGQLTETSVEWLRSGLQADGTLVMMPKRLDADCLVRVDGFYVALLELDASVAPHARAFSGKV